MENKEYYDATDLDHARMRIDTMTLAQLFTRLYKMTRLHKLNAFNYVVVQEIDRRHAELSVIYATLIDYKIDEPYYNPKYQEKRDELNSWKGLLDAIRYRTGEIISNIKGDR